MFKHFSCCLTISLFLLLGLNAHSNDIDTQAIIDRLDLGNPVSTPSEKKGVISQIRGNKGDSWGSGDFYQAFNQGRSSANDVGLTVGGGSTLKTVESHQQINIQGANGAWSFVINGWNPQELATSSDGSFTVYRSSGVIANYGNRYEFIFYLPEANTKFVDTIEEKIAKEIKNFQKDFKNSTVTFPRTDKGQLSIHVVTNYDKKTSSSKLKREINDLLLDSRQVMNAFLDQSVRVENQYLKDMRKAKHANLSKEQFYEVFTVLTFVNNLPTLDQPSDETKDGYAVFTLDKEGIRIWNFKDRFTVGVAVSVDASVSEEQRKTLSSQWLTWGEKKLKKGAKSIEVKRNSYDGDDYLVMAVTYPLDGTLSGKDIEKNIDFVIRDKREAIINELHKIYNKL